MKFQGISNNSTCGESRASSAARRFFVGPLAGANQKTARIVDPMRRFFVTISEQSSGGKDSVDSLCGEFLEMPSNLSNRINKPRQIFHGLSGLSICLLRRNYAFLDRRGRRSLQRKMKLPYEKFALTPPFRGGIYHSSLISSRASEES